MNILFNKKKKFPKQEIEQKMLTKANPFFLVDKSPWPICIGMSVLPIGGGLVLYIHGHSLLVFLGGFILVILIAKNWIGDIVKESTFIGLHTKSVKSSLLIGLFLLIVSEVIFFFSFFWALFHRALAPSIEIGTQWPPIFINILNPLTWPLFNSVLLVSSGAIVNLSFIYFIMKKNSYSIFWLNIRILLGVLFTSTQAFEFWSCRFTIRDGIFGTCFFVMTGFHGLHVIVGIIILTVQIIRIKNNHLSSNHRVGLVFAIWYWHFVDVVWLFLYLVIYLWSIL